MDGIDWRGIAVQLLKENLSLLDLISQIARASGVPGHHVNLERLRELKAVTHGILAKAERA